MGQLFDEIPEFLVKWMEKQHMFWVATAPLSIDGHINLSSKGIEGTFHVVDSHTVWYEDLTGSGCETIAHIRENGRITVLFNAFEGPPRIARLFGKGTVHEFGSPEYNALLPPEVRQPGSRSVIMIDVHKVGTSCGYGVPLFEFKSHRTKLVELCVQVENVTTSEGLKGYWAQNNLVSIDGLPGLVDAHESTQPFPPKILQKHITQRRKWAVDKAIWTSFIAGMLVTLAFLKGRN